MGGLDRARPSRKQSPLYCFVKMREGRACRGRGACASAEYTERFTADTERTEVLGMPHAVLSGWTIHEVLI